ncbi:NfeD family protein [Butyrivibrio sp. AE3004]|uniref:NfeD family protein n=1 Tax=Butyrivibrio sp. AE3004 TaxID=1506994 RepID=UPI00068CBF14|nr:NfeD family protein [Butyrivibrio sp. AE3004]
MYNQLFGVSPMMFWLILTVALAIIELLTMGLSTIWFAIGALAAFVAAIVGANIPMQIVIFIIVSVLMLLLVRPLSVKLIGNKIEKTNIDALVGRKVNVSKEVDNIKETGCVILDGTTWNARSIDDDSIIPVGETVIIEKVVGNKLIVKKV